MTRLLIVGSGASGVHLAITALERGFDVTMVDLGHERPPPVAPEASFDGLKTALADPVGYFLGERGEGVVYPATKPSYYGHPPSKSYVFRTPDSLAVGGTMAALFSFARGGLAEAWTAGSYEFGPTDAAEFPFPYADLERGYREVVARIGVGGEADDLERFIPLGPGYLPPLGLDAHSARLVGRYRVRREELNRRLGFHLGRSRVATLSRAHRGRAPCAHLGRCLWGCPVDAIYSPAWTLRECLAHPRFDYRPGRLVTHFDYDDAGRVAGVVATRAEDGAAETIRADLYALAAGALLSSKIVLDSIHRRTGRVERLPGLMDNRQIHVPFLSLGMVGAGVETASYQYHHLAFGLERPDPAEYVHGQITTLRAASVHPIVQSLPVDFRGAIGLFRALRVGLGLANVNLHDRRRPDSVLTLRPRPDGGGTELRLDYADDPGEAALAADAVGRVTRALRRLGAIVPRGMTRILPKGASVHYAGTLPMSPSPARLGCRPDGRSYDFPNLYFADGAGFPFLPAKNLTLTLMANAVRIARSLAPAS